MYLLRYSVFMIYFNSLGKYGGFGNQLFQYAVAYVHAKRFQTEVCTTPHKSYYQRIIHQKVNLMNLIFYITSL